jgi:hypothetical protein
MAAQLDILALEPFYGGVRRSMLETLMRCSRHRWTLLKLPPRRIERRLTAASHWFAEQLSRHWIGRVDLLFTSEAMNVADLLRLVPDLANKPRVVYFHDNQLPDPRHPRDEDTHDLVNLNTAQSATELWFNSEFHLQLFHYRAAALIEKHPELSSRNPLLEVLPKCKIMRPPMDLRFAASLGVGKPKKRDQRKIFVETRDADVRMLNRSLATLKHHAEEFELVTVGPVENLSDDFPRTVIPEWDEQTQTEALLSSGLFVSTRRSPTIDHYAVLALAARCWPIVPAEGVYLELIPDSLHNDCLYNGTPSGLASRIQDLWLQESDPINTSILFDTATQPFNAIAACKAMDERIDELAAANPNTTD